jgi:integrase/recombinase XerD
MTTKNELLVLKQDFIEYLEKECERSKKTIENYNRYLNRFLTHTKVKSPKAITEAVVHEYSTWLKKQTIKPKNGENRHETLNEKTQNYYLIALRGFLKYLREIGVTSCDAKKVTLSKTTLRPSENITENELQRLLLAPDGKDLKSIRDRALLHLLFSTGLRVSELRALNASLDLSHSTISILGKGGVFREVRLTSEAKDAVQTYMHTRIDAGEALFVNNGKRTTGEGETRLSVRSIQRIVKFYAIKAGIQRKVTPHVLRHTLAKSLLHSGVDESAVQNILGHTHISSTHMYSTPQSKEKHKKFHRAEKKEE